MDDELIGDANDNKLVGGKGNDTLVGGDGKDKLLGGNNADRLIGGAANDQLTGNGGNDVFVFDGDSKNDTIKDFQQGSDTMEIADHAGGFASLVISDDNGDRLIEHDGGSIRLEGQAGLALTAGDFDFVA